MQLTCGNGHVLTRYVIEGCPAHDKHHVYICGMRRGQRACGDVVVLPPYNPACNEDDEEDD